MQSKTIIVKSNCMLELSQNVYTQVGAHYHHAFKLKNGVLVTHPLPFIQICEYEWSLISFFVVIHYRQIPEATAAFINLVHGDNTALHILLLVQQ